jgi:glycosyltransferase involved in cell wall biosynthesis
MKILYTLNSGNPGGMEQHVLDLVKGMVDSGHDVYVWCPEGPFTDNFRRSGAIVEIKTVKHEFDLKYIVSLYEFLKSKKIDIIHVHEVKAVANSLFAAFLAGTDVKISHTHTPISAWKVSPLKKIINVVINTTVVDLFASKEIALTQYARAAKLKEGVFPFKLAVISNGIDVNKFKLPTDIKDNYKNEIRTRYNIPQDALVIGNISRLTEEKGHEPLIKAFVDVKKEAYLLIAGGGKLEEPLKKLITDLGLEKRVIITGIFDAQDLIKYYSAFDYFVFPSLAEGFGYVLAEAMMSGLPVLCSDLPVLKELAADTVDYFKAGNAADLSDRLNDMLTKSSEQLLSTVKRAQLRIEENYSLERFVSNYLNLYENINARSH